jgi:hypothetical protein
MLKGLIPVIFGFAHRAPRNDEVKQRDGIVQPPRRGDVAQMDFVAISRDDVPA